MEKHCLISKIWISVLALIVAMPILVVGLSWIYPSHELWAHFSEYVLPQLAISTTILLLGVGVGVTILGTVLAYLVVMVEFPGRSWLEWALFLPFAIPAYVLAFIYIGVFDYSGYVQVWLREVFGFSGFDIRSGSWAIIMTFVLVFYPYVYMMSRASFKRQKLSMIESGKLLGANPWQVFWKISLPLARPAVAAGVLVTLMETLADFGVVSLFNYDTLTTAIYSAWGDFRSIEVAAQLASILVLIAFFLIYFEKKARGGAKYYSSEMSNRQVYHAKGYVGVLISLFVFGVFMLSFAMPMLQLVIWAVDTFNQEWSDKYLSLISSTVILTLTASVLTVIIATILALPSPCKKGGVKIFIRIATLGYALPGSVMAVGLLYGLEKISAQNYLFGTVILLLFAYISRFMAIAYSSIDAAGEQIKPVFTQSARLLGANRLKMVWQVYLPMMKPGILAAALLVAVDVMKELPATYLLRPFGWDTLAIQVYELNAEGLFDRAAVPSLLMVMFGAILMIIFKWLDKKA